LLQLSIEAVTQPIEFKSKNYTMQLFNTHHLSVAFSFTIVRLNKKKETK